MQKILLVLGVVCLQVVFGEFTENDVRPSHRECFEELNLDLDAVKKHVNDDWSVTEGNDDVNRFSLCTFKKEHLLNDDDTINTDSYKDLLVNNYFVKLNLTLDNPTEYASNALDACKSVQGSDAGDTIIKHNNCIVNQINNNP